MYNKFLKRVIDIVLSLVGLVILSPIMLITALLIKIDSKGPIIFKQKRLGYKGKEFYIYKFRSMSIGAEKKGVYELKGDPRITKVGKIIRKTSIDELPQFVNILKGEMSLIGPRPALTYHPWRFEQYTEYQKRMFDVKPGVTGWAQINGRKDVEWPTRIDLNIEYIDRMSFRFDTYIFVRTISKVITSEGNINKNKTVKSKECGTYEV